MAYITSFHKGTTVQFILPIGSLYPNTTLEAWDRVKIVFAATKGGTPVIDKTVLIDEVTGTCDVELTNVNTDVAIGFYFYEIYFQHSDTSEVSAYEEEYVIEAGRVQIKERV